MAGSSKREQDPQGDQRVVQVLDALPAPCRVLHDLDIPGSKASLAHLVVAPGGIFAVDAAAFDGKVTVDKGMLFHGRRSLAPRVDALRFATRVFAERLNQPIQPVICFTDAAPEQPVTKVGDVTATSPESLNGHLISQPTRMNEREIALVAERAQVLVRRTSAPATFGAGTALGGTSGYHPSPPLRTSPAHPQFRPPPKPRRIRRSFGSVLKDIIVKLILLAMLGGVVFVIIKLLTGEIDERFDNLTTQTTRPPVTVPGDTTPATSPVPGTTVDPTADPARPRISFDCPVAGADWVASAVDTDRDPAAAGWHLWFRIDAGPWTYWGEFRNGVTAPTPLRHLPSRTKLTIGLDRTKVENPARIAEVTTEVAPRSRC